MRQKNGGGFYASFRYSVFVKLWNTALWNTAKFKNKRQQTQNKSGFATKIDLQILQKPRFRKLFINYSFDQLSKASLKWTLTSTFNKSHSCNYCSRLANHHWKSRTNKCDLNSAPTWKRMVSFFSVLATDHLPTLIYLSFLRQRLIATKIGQRKHIWSTD